MRTAIARLAIAAAVAAAPAVAHAQVPAFTSTPAPSIAFADTSSSARAQVMIASAERSWKQYDLGRARRDYGSAIDFMRSHDVYAGPALVSLAHVTYATDSKQRAAKVLVDAAREAAKYGDIALQARTLFEASVLYQEAGDEGAAKALLVDLRKLTTSPYLPQDVKEEIARRTEAR